MGAMKPRLLLLDNYDSYTFNLFQICADVFGEEPLVYHNDRIAIEDIKRLIRDGVVDSIVLSPGPGSPLVAADVGVCLDVLKQLPDIPVLGVCLGHQALAHAHGASVVRAPEPVHGRLSALRHNGHPLFAGCPSGPGAGFDVVRYHSLAVDPASLPPQLVPLAWTCAGHHAVTLQRDTATAAAPPPAAEVAAESSSCAADGGAPILMALAHATRPHYGVQFHPESVATRFGIQLLANFRDLVAAHYRRPQPQPVADGLGPPGRCLDPRPWPAAAEAAVKWPSAQQAAGQQQEDVQLQHVSTGGWDDRLGSSSSSTANESAAAVTADAAAGLGPGTPATRLCLAWQKLPGVLAAVGGSQRIFEALAGPKGGTDTFWLDSSATERARFSFMGCPGGQLWRRITYRLAAPVANSQQQQQPGVLTVSSADGTSVSAPLSVFDYLETQLAMLKLWSARNSSSSSSSSKDGLSEAAAALPFDFWGGFVGYLGYELKAECGGHAAHEAPTPDAAWFFADRTVAVDHRTGDVFLLALYDSSRSSSSGGEAARHAALGWLAATEQLVERLASHNGAAAGNGAVTTNGTAAATGANGVAATAPRPPRTPFVLRDARPRYVSNVTACQEALHAGESYELCLTTALERSGRLTHPWTFYSTLRSINPAPYAAWLTFGSSSHNHSSSGSSSTDAVTICCSSPERFLRGSRGGVLEARPIKGTARRDTSDPVADAALAAALASCEKERAENLMIVDLLRNDLGRVCEPGSVHVPGLIELESYATVHQLVSTVRGLRRSNVGPVAAARAAFPGGSMTGAPKVRSMEILDCLEGAPRGVYSGSLGYFCVTGAFDLNIVIRTAVFAGDTVSVGAGGAVVVQSTPEGEYDEMRLKAAALMRAFETADAAEDAAEAAGLATAGGTAAAPAGGTAAAPVDAAVEQRKVAAAAGGVAVAAGKAAAAVPGRALEAARLNGTLLPAGL